MANPLELGFLEKEEYGVSACVWYAGTGTDGIFSVADIFSGKISPSGRLVDTYAYDSLSSPSCRTSAISVSSRQTVRPPATAT